MFTKNCPDCKTQLTYSNKYKLKRAVFDKSKCRSCGIKTSVKWQNRSSKFPSKETKEKMSKSAKSRSKKGLPKEFLSMVNRGSNWMGKLHPGHGQHRSEETKRKMRLSAIARLKRNYGKVYPGYNPEACRTIEEYGQQHGFNFQHALNGGEFHIKELGFWVDGYDMDKNAVIEIDELHHYQNGKLRKKDVSRQKEITEHLGCEFIRIRI